MFDMDKPKVIVNCKQLILYSRGKGFRSRPTVRRLRRNSPILPLSVRKNFEVILCNSWLHYTSSRTDHPELIILPFDTCNLRYRRRYATGKVIIIIIIIIIINLQTKLYWNFCALYITSAFRLHSKVIQSDKFYYLCQTHSHARKMIQVNLSVRYSSSISRSVWRAICKVRTWKENCLRLESRGDCVTDSLNMHHKALCVFVGGGEGVHSVLSLHVRGYWDVTSHTVAQIYRRFGRTW